MGRTTAIGGHIDFIFLHYRNEKGVKMKIDQAILKMMDARHITMAELARAANLPYSTLWERIHKDNITLRKLQDIIAPLNYDIVLVPKGTIHRPGWYQIE